VIGRTLIDGRAVQVELYAPEEDAPIPELIVLGHETVGALWEANAATAGSGAVTMDSDFEADENAAADGSIEESEQEDGSFSTDEPLSEDEEVAAAFEEMSALAGKSFQPLYWAVVLYLSASILLGMGIWVSFKLRPRAA
jgi:hypothetical protein